MPRFIDAEKISLTAALKFDVVGDALVPLRDVQRAIAQTPTEDAVIVVRCKECVHRGKRQRCDGRKPNFYCADGIRREQK